MEEPSPWLRRCAPLIGDGAQVLDCACGSGRHARWLAARGLRVTAVDRDETAIRALAGTPGIQTLAADLEGPDWPLAGRIFDAVIVTRYLFRPRFAALLDCIAPEGLLIYETFMDGQEAFGRPANPDFLLRPHELLQRMRNDFTVTAFEQGFTASPAPAMLQRICALRSLRPGALPA